MIAAVAMQIFTGWMRTKGLEAKHSNFSLLHRVSESSLLAPKWGENVLKALLSEGETPGESKRIFRRSAVVVLLCSSSFSRYPVSPVYQSRRSRRPSGVSQAPCIVQYRISRRKLCVTVRRRSIPLLFLWSIEFRQNRGEVSCQEHSCMYLTGRVSSLTHVTDLTCAKP